MQKTVKPTQAGDAGAGPVPKLKGSAAAGALAQRAREAIKTMDEGLKAVQEMKVKQVQKRKFRVCACGSRDCDVGPFTYEEEDDPKGGA